ncbi:MAG: outer membrane protein assembly factor BamD [Terriglobales bacterium]|jgi:outer membrane protein assembly factor BamD
MHHRRPTIFVVCALFLFLGLTACTSKHVTNPVAQVDSKQPDKVLFDRAMDALKHNRYDVARMTLQTLINTYPDSEYVARAMLAIGDSWYNEGESASLLQAQSEYRDFQIFFPNMPEAAEAQMKVAEIEYRQMEKPDRDYTHAKKAEDEYRALILKYPDSKLVPEAKQRLRDVEEILGEREFAIGHFYYLREAYPAAIARMESLVDAYPLFSGADEALFLAGDSYQKDATRIRIKVEATNPNAAGRASLERMTSNFDEHAAENYARLLTRYPLSARAGEATQRLQAMNRPVPKATPEAIAQNRAERDSRTHPSTFEKAVDNFRHHPDTALASKVGEPPLSEPKPIGAPDIVRSAGTAALGTADPGKHTLSVETTAGTGTPPANEPAPRSDTPAAKPNDPNAIPELTPTNTPPAPVVDPQGPAPAPPQVNDAAKPEGASQAPAAPASGSPAATPADAAGKTAATPSDDSSQSTSKEKKKKGWHKLFPSF